METTKNSGQNPRMDRKPRLMIKSLRLENFKSYGGVVEVGPYHKNFSAIVGPNGSGKSNVIDAMLFVFGKRAKQMRLNKISELIHNSDRSKSIDSASVTVFLQEIVDIDDSEFEVVDGSELAICRTVFRNGQSRYTINREGATFTEVQQLLGAKGVDLENNRFLILQGEVEQISLMKSKAPNAHEDGLLEYLEDIIGSNKYVEMIDGTAKELEETNDERSLKLTRVRAAEKERDALEEDKNEAEEYVRRDMELRKKRVLMFRLREYEVQKSQQQVKDKIIHLQDNADKEEKKKEEIESERRELETILETRKAEYDEVQEALSRSRAEFSAFERRDVKYQEDIKHLKTKEKQLKSVATREEEKAVTELENAARCASAKSELEMEEESIRKRIQKAENELEKQFERVKTSTSHLRVEMEVHQKQLLPFAATRDARTKDVEIVRAELEMAEEKINAPVRALNDVQNQLEQVRRQKTERFEHRRSELQSELGSVRAKTKQVEAILQSKNEEKQSVAKSAQEARRRHEEAKSVVSSIAASSRTESALFRAAERKQLCGIVGRLSELGRIEDKYDVAVGAAAGGTLRNIVVEKAEDAQACVEYLREHSLGRATFIILDKLEHLKRGMDREQSARPGTKSCQRLFDLITIPKPEHRVAFYYALRDTLVAETIDEATKVAYQPTKRNRVVTVGGQLIESSGAMTGGGQQAPRANLGSRSGARGTAKPEDITRLEDELAQLQTLYASIRAEITTLKKELEDYRASTTSLETSMEKLALEERSNAEREEELVTQLPALTKAMEAAKSGPHAKRLKELQKQLHALIKALEDAQTPCEKLQKTISKLQEKILSAGGEPLANAKRVKEELTSRLEEVMARIHKLGVEAQSSTGAAEKAKAAAAHTTEEMVTTRDALVQRKQEFKALEKEAAIVHEAVSKTEQLLETKREAMQDLQIKYDKLSKSLSKFKSSMLEIEHKIEDLKKMLTELAGNERHWAKMIVQTRKELADVDDTILDDTQNGVTNEEDGSREGSLNREYDAMDVDDAVAIREEDQDLEDFVFEDVQVEITSLEAALGQLKPNHEAIQEYRRKDNEYSHHIDELDVITERRDATRKSHEKLKKQRHEEFMAGFHIISMKLKEMYQMITLGGDAELELVDSLDPFAEGIVFSVRPPKKSWKNISNLSGGEKTLSSLALVFALHHFKPTPLYFMDEIDAALDFKNVSIVANYLKERTKDAQFIIISLRNNMFEIADRLVGIYKTCNSTKSVTINPHKFKIPVGLHPPQTVP